MNKQNLENLAEVLEEMPEFIRRLTIGLSLEELKRKPTKKEFSILEHIWHLRDIEQEGYAARIGKLLTENQPLLKDIDGDKLAEERDYNNLNFATGFEEFCQARKNNVRQIKDLTLEQLNRVGTLENVGAITLGQLLMKLLEHDEEHRQTLEKLTKSIKD